MPPIDSGPRLYVFSRVSLHFISNSRCPISPRHGFVCYINAAVFKVITTGCKPLCHLPSNYGGTLARLGIKTSPLSSDTYPVFRYRLPLLLEVAAFGQNAHKFYVYFFSLMAPFNLSQPESRVSNRCPGIGENAAASTVRRRKITQGAAICPKDFVPQSHDPLALLPAGGSNFQLISFHILSSQKTPAKEKINVAPSIFINLHQSLLFLWPVVRVKPYF
jgi:hypothetical protein